MPTTVDSTIGTGGDYTTLQAWEDAAPANLVTADQIWRGLLKNQTFTHTGSSAVLTIAGSTSDSTRYKELTCESGASFKDNASKLTNALRANASNGALITSNTTNYVNSLIVATEANCRLTGLQISVTNAATGKCLTGGNLYNCILESTGANSTDNASVARQIASARNCLFISRRAGVTGIVGHGTGTPSYWNCTFVVPSDLTAATNAITTNYTYTRTFRNCAFFGVTNVINNTSGATFTTCRTNSSQSISGVTQIAYDTSTGSGFENITDSTRDFRIKSTSTLVDNGTTYSSDAPADIVGTSRPQGSAYDVGCWEYSSGGGSASTGSLSGTLANVTLAATGTLTIGGTLAATMADVALSATAQLSISATLAATLDVATLVATGSLSLAAALAATLDDAVLASTGAGSNTGTLSSVLADASLAGTGTLPLSGTVSVALVGAALTATGALPIAAALSAALAPVTLASQGSSSSTGTVAAQLADAALTAIGAVQLRGMVDVTLGAATLSATGSLSLSGVLNHTLDAVQAVAVGSRPLYGVLSATLADIGVVSAGGGRVAKLFPLAGYVQAFPLAGQTQLFPLANT